MKCKKCGTELEREVDWLILAFAVTVALAVVALAVTVALAVFTLAVTVALAVVFALAVFALAVTVALAVVFALADDLIVWYCPKCKEYRCRCTI